MLLQPLHPCRPKPCSLFSFLQRPQVARDKLVALGTCIGKFTHSGKFRLTIGALDVLSQYAKYKASLVGLLVECVYLGG